MSGAAFVTCPSCGRLMLGQHSGGHIYPQPHECNAKEQARLDEIAAVVAAVAAAPEWPEESSATTEADR